MLHCSECDFRVRVGVHSQNVVAKRDCDNYYLRKTPGKGGGGTICWCNLDIQNASERARTWLKHVGATSSISETCDRESATTFWECTPFGLLLCYSGDVRSILTDVLSLLPATVLTPLAFVFPVSFAAEFRSQFRSHREWMSLQIN